MLREPAFVERLARVGVVPSFRTPAQLADDLAGDLAVAGPIGGTQHDAGPGRGPLGARLAAHERLQLGPLPRAEDHRSGASSHGPPYPESPVQVNRTFGVEH